MRLLVMVAVVVSVLAGCMQTGRKVEKEEYADFEVGKTTYADVVRKLGPPTQKMDLGGGSTRASYNYSGMDMNAAGFIPLIGAFLRKTKSEVAIVNFSFQNLVLTEVTSSNSENCMTLMGNPC